MQNYRTINISQELHRKLKIRAAQEGTTITRLIIENWEKGTTFDSRLTPQDSDPLRKENVATSAQLKKEGYEK